MGVWSACWSAYMHVSLCLPSHCLLMIFSAPAVPPRRLTERLLPYALASQSPRLTEVVLDAGRDAVLHFATGPPPGAGGRDGRHA